MERTIQINYDLRKPGRNYQSVYDYIKSHGVYAKPLASLWLVRTTKTARTIRDEMMKLVDANDRVVTFDVTDDYWATNFVDEHTDWMHNHMETFGLLRAS